MTANKLRKREQRRRAKFPSLFDRLRKEAIEQGQYFFAACRASRMSGRALHDAITSRDEWAERAGISPTSSNVTRAVRVLSERQITEERDGRIYATGRLFPAEVPA